MRHSPHAPPTASASPERARWPLPAASARRPPRRTSNRGAKGCVWPRLKPAGGSPIHVRSLLRLSRFPQLPFCIKKRLGSSVAFPLSLPVVGDGQLPRHREDHVYRLIRASQPLQETLPFGGARRFLEVCRDLSAEDRMMASTQTATRFARGRKSTSVSDTIDNRFRDTHREARHLQRSNRAVELRSVCCRSSEIRGEQSSHELSTGYRIRKLGCHRPRYRRSLGHWDGGGSTHQLGSRTP
jgi:hypothetical protein